MSKRVESIRRHFTCDVSKGPHLWGENMAGDVSCRMCHLCVGPLSLAKDVDTLLAALAAPCSSPAKGGG